jgi:hypothetical protein
MTDKAIATLVDRLEAVAKRLEAVEGKIGNQSARFFFFFFFFLLWFENAVLCVARYEHACHNSSYISPNNLYV